MPDVKHGFTIHPKAAAPRVFDIGHTLDDVYGSYSIVKARAYTYCKELCDRYDGYNFVSRRRTRSRLQSVSTLSIPTIIDPCELLSRAPTITLITWTSHVHNQRFQLA